MLLLCSGCERTYGNLSEEFRHALQMMDALQNYKVVDMAGAWPYVIIAIRHAYVSPRTHYYIHHYMHQ